MRFSDGVVQPSQGGPDVPLFVAVSRHAGRSLLHRRDGADAVLHAEKEGTARAEFVLKAD